MEERISKRPKSWKIIIVILNDIGNDPCKTFVSAKHWQRPTYSIGYAKQIML